MKPVTAECKTDRLGADSARAIEQIQGRRPNLAAHDSIDRARLRFDGRIPVRINEMIIAREPVVETPRRI
jgi:hypothetical protein